MLKRNQVLLNDWLVDFIKYRAEEYDVSFSETIRLALCLYYGTMISKRFPEHKFQTSLEEIVEKMNRYSKTSAGEEEKHKTISSVYFEARKAIEFCVKQEKKQKAKKDR